VYIQGYIQPASASVCLIQLDLCGILNRRICLFAVLCYVWSWGSSTKYRLSDGEWISGRFELLLGIRTARLGPAVRRTALPNRTCQHDDDDDIHYHYSDYIVTQYGDTQRHSFICLSDEFNSFCGRRLGWLPAANV